MDGPWYPRDSSATGYNPVSTEEPTDTITISTDFNFHQPNETIFEEEELTCCQIVGATIFSIGLLFYVTFMLCYGIYFRFPKYDPEFHVESLSISSFSAAKSDLVGWNVTFKVTNPKRLSTFTFENSAVSISHNGEMIGATVMRPFLIRHSMNINMHAGVAPSSVIHHRWNLDAIIGHQNLHGPIAFDVQAVGKFVRNEADDESQRLITVQCEDVMVKFMPETGVGVMTSGPSKCQVKAEEPEYVWDVYVP